MSASKLFIGTLQGGTGIPFDDTPSDPHNSYITKIGIHYDSDIEGLVVTYSGDEERVTSHGNQHSTIAEITLGAGEFISKIEGVANDRYLVELAFTTNRRIVGPFGGSIGQSFVWESPAGTETGPMRLVAFSGYCDSDGYLAGVRGIFCVPPPATMKSIRYEPRTQQPISPFPFVAPSSLVPPGPSQSASSVSFSSFTFHIMNPTITLFVGEDRVTFYVHKDTLCELLFFQAALGGGFKEAAEQAITLPEDNPIHMSALIEFLYTGNYTYSYDPDTVRLHDESTVPSSDTAECMFHIGVYVVASKYCCQGLVDIAERHIKYVEGELEGIDILRLWKAAYSVDMDFLARKTGPRSGDGLATWVKKMFKENRAEMEKTIVEFPMLASHLLCSIAGGDD